MKLKPLIAAILLFFQHPILADIITDGTVGNSSNLGRVQSINAIDGQLTIGQELGSLKGGNLYHSFQQFDIESGETAIFTGDDTIQNVISRVTGGNESHINGILRSQIGSADFYFINPAGVVFEENSQVDVPASFHISTAGELIFNDGSSFNALNPEASTLTVATPEAFGFSSGQIGSLKIVGGQLKFKPGTDVSLSANSLNIQQKASINVEHDLSTECCGFIEEPGIRLNLAAIDSLTTQEIPITGLEKTATTGGDLSIEDSKIIVSGSGSGRLSIHAGKMTAHSSSLFVDNIDSQDVKPNDGVEVVIDSLELVHTSLANRAQSSQSSAKGSNVSVIASNMIQLLEGGNISSEAALSSKAPLQASGHSGKVTVEAGQLIINGQNSGIVTEAKTLFGTSGDIEISAREFIQILNGGRISSIQKGRTGNSGKVTVEAGQLIINGYGKETTIETVRIGSFGNTGDVKVDVDESMQVLNGGTVGVTLLIPLDGSNKEQAGNVLIEARQLIIDGQDTKIENITNKSAETSGNIGLFVDEFLKVRHGGKISTIEDSSANPFGGSAGGSINIKSGKWIQLKDAKITTSALGDLENKAGDIIIEVPVLILDTGEILASTSSTDSTGGNVIIGEVLDPDLTLEKIVNDANIIKPVQFVASEDSFNSPGSMNIIRATEFGDLKITSPELNIVGALADVITPTMDIERLSQDPCAHGDENSFKKLGHGGAPAFQHGENYLLINRFDETEGEPDDRDLLEVTPSTHTDLENTATECAKFQRSSLTGHWQ
jgi:filamentous hemagglutinin family protein